MEQAELDRLKAAQYHTSTALAAAICYGTAPEHLEKLKADFRRADEAYCDYLGLNYAIHSRPYAA